MPVREWIQAELRRPSTTTDEDRRQAPRCPLCVRVLIVEDRFATSGFTENVSRQGALVETSAPLRVGTSYEIWLELPGGMHHTNAHVIRELPGFLYAMHLDEPIPYAPLDVTLPDPVVV